jgi:hypothetical protein
MVHPSAVDEKLCFVIMPFRRPFNDYYEEIIRPAVAASGLTPRRGDEIYGTQPIIRDIWNNIRKCRIIVADVSGRNPNVNYELGLAHACGKPTVIITRRMRDVPFDYRHLRCISYDPTSIRGWAGKLLDNLTDNIKAALAEKPYGDSLMWAPDALGLGGGISIEELMARERPGPGGDLQSESEVIVQTPQPIEEVRKDIAGRIRANIDAGIKYTYILDSHSLDVIAGLVHNLVGFPGAPFEKTDGFADIGQTLTFMQDRLRVYVIQKRWPFRFCIHNSRDVVKASLYLQDDDGYTWMEWMKGRSAYATAKQLREEVHLADKSGTGCIRGVSSVLGEEQRVALWDDIQKRFNFPDGRDDLQQGLKTFCFGQQL